MTDFKRLPFDERVDNPPGIRVTDRDIEVVNSVYEHRFLLRDQVQALHFPSRVTANRRLKLLFQHEYLQRIFVPGGLNRNARNTQAIYCLDREGARLLAAEFGVPREEIDWYPHRNDVGEYFIHHRLRINDFRIALTLAAEERGDEIVVWVPERKLRELGEKVEDERGRKYPVVPDAYFIYQDGETDKKAHFFLELDRATMENRRFAKKIKAYILYWQSGAYQERYRTRSLRVLTVTTSRRRLRNLKETTEDTGGKSMFWFTTFEELDPERILGSVWEVAGQDQRARLIGGERRRM